MMVAVYIPRGLTYRAGLYGQKHGNYFNIRLIKPIIIYLTGVPDRAAWAPGNVSTPPGRRCWHARLAAMADDHTLCFHMRSALRIKSVQ